MRHTTQRLVESVTEPRRTGRGSTTQADAGTRRGRADAFWIAGLTFVGYCSCSQDAFYRTDGQFLLMRLVRDLPPHPMHLLAEPLARVFLHLAWPLGLSIYDAMVLFSAVSTAVAVLPLHHAARLAGLSRARAALAAAMFAGAPAVLFYATIVEFHAIFLPWAGLAFLATTRLATRPSLARGVVAGTAAGFASVVHASGAILPALLVPWALVASARMAADRGRVLRGVAALLIVHASCMLGLPVLFRLLGVLPPVPDGAAENAGVAYFVRHLDTLLLADVRHLPGTLVHEWLWPLAPASVLAFWRPRGAPGTAALLCALAPYLGSSWLLMRQENEYGAYVLPVGFLAVVLAASRIRVRFGVVVVFIALLAGLVQVGEHEEQYTGRDAVVSHLGHALRELGGRVFVVTGPLAEMDAALMHLPNRERPDFVPLDEVLSAPPELFDRVARDYRRLRYRVFVTGAALSRLRERPEGAARLEHWKQGYLLTRTSLPGGGVFLDER